MINENWKNYWKLITNEKKNTSLDMFHFCMLKALKAKSNQKKEIAETLLRKAFPPIVSDTKLANGRYVYDTLAELISRARWTKTIFGFDRSVIMDDEGLAEYRNLLEQLKIHDIKENEPEYLFLFVRQDITPEYQAVQAAHAAYKAGCVYGTNPDETYFVLIGLADEVELNQVEKLLTTKYCEYVLFREPDIGNVITAMATKPIKAHRKNFLRKYEKLVF